MMDPSRCELRALTAVRGLQSKTTGPTPPKPLGPFASSIRALASEDISCSLLSVTLLSFVAGKVEVRNAAAERAHAHGWTRILGKPGAGPRSLKRQMTWV